MSCIKNTFALFIFFSIGIQTCIAAPADFQARYITKKSGISIAGTEIRLNRKDDNTFVYISETEPLGLLSLFRSDHITEKSTLENINDKLRPIRFQYIHKGSKKNRDVDLTFNWENHLVSNSVAGKEWTLVIPDGVLDEFSIQLELMQDLTKGKTELTYSIVDDGKLKTYRFDIMGKEEVEVPAGTFDTVKIKRVRENSKRLTYMWVAPALQYLPVRLEHVEEDSSTFYMVLDKVRGAISGGKSLPEDAEWE